MKKTLFPFLFLAALLLVACEQPKDTAEGTICGFDQAESPNGQGVSVASFELVPLEASEASMITSVKYVACVDSLVLVQTSEALLVFGRSGRFITQIGRMGSGPGEYVTMSAFAVDERQRRVCLVDEASKRFLFYGYDGTFLIEKKMDAATMPLWIQQAVFDGDDLVCTHMMFNSENTYLSRFNLATGTETVLHTLPVRTANTGEMTGTSMLAKRGDRLSVLLPFDNKVYALKGDTLSPEWVVETQKTMVNQKELAAIENFSIMTYADFATNDRFTGFTALYETDYQVLLNVLFTSAYFLIDKANQTGRLFTYQVEEGQTNLPLLSIVGTQGESFIGVLEPMRALSLKSSLPSETNDPHLRALIDHIATMSFDANPTLLFYTLK